MNTNDTSRDSRVFVYGVHLMSGSSTGTGGGTTVGGGTGGTGSGTEGSTSSTGGGTTGGGTTGGSTTGDTGGGSTSGTGGGGTGGSTGGGTTSGGGQSTRGSINSAWPLSHFMHALKARVELLGKHFAASYADHAAGPRAEIGSLSLLEFDGLGIS